MKVSFHYGKTGSGKTLLAMYELLIDRLNGRRPMSNIKSCRIPNHVYVDAKNLIASLDIDSITDKDSPEAILNNLEPKTLVLDEISKWWDSRQHARIENQYLAYFVDQSRKRNINLIVIDQHIGGFDVRGRQLVDKLIRCVCEHVSGSEQQIPKNFHYFVTDLEWHRFYKYYIPASVLEPFYDLYNTYEHVIPRDMLTH